VVGNGSGPARAARDETRTTRATNHPGALESRTHRGRRGASSLPRVLVGVTTGGVLEDLDPSSGSPVRDLATGATGDEVSVTPDGSSVYFEAAVGCMHEIEKVLVAGGTPEMVATGSVPALSPDGSELAYVRQPLENQGPCEGQTVSASSYTLVVRVLATGVETTYPVSPTLANGRPNPIDHVSWSFDGRELAVSIEGGQGDDGWQLVVVHPATDDYYFSGSGVSLTGADASSSYYREGTFMPDGELFVNRICCEGPGATVTSTLMLEVDPSTGAIVHQVAIGILGNDHTSLDVDPSGHWLLYLSGNELLVSENGERPNELATGFEAAAW
ncbi:MAG: TolB family protein, partial [Acidimicrobiales bacterium]